MLVVVVGPCGSGKTTLVKRLQALGYTVRAVAQEHSHIDALWKHGGTPDALIFLDASPATITRRRRNEFPEWLYNVQIERLGSARRNATLYLHTDRVSSVEVQRRVIEHLSTLQSARAAQK